MKSLFQLVRLWIVQIVDHGLKTRLIANRVEEGRESHQHHQILPISVREFKRVERGVVVAQRDVHDTDIVIQHLGIARIIGEFV